MFDEYRFIVSENPIYLKLYAGYSGTWCVHTHDKEGKLVYTWKGHEKLE
jgi:hypothetical protein